MINSRNLSAKADQAHLLACSGGLWWTYMDPQILLKNGSPVQQRNTAT
jgi:hypothetical protein